MLKNKLNEYYDLLYQQSDIQNKDEIKDKIKDIIFNCTLNIYKNSKNLIKDKNLLLIACLILSMKIFLAYDFIIFDTLEGIISNKYGYTIKEINKLIFKIFKNTGYKGCFKTEETYKKIEYYKECIFRILGYDIDQKDIILFLKMFLKIDFHPIFKLNKIINDRLNNFFYRKYSNKIGKIKKELTLNNDLCILHNLHQLLYTPPNKNLNNSREDSRINDISQELFLIKKLISPNFNYLDLGCSEGKITKAVVKSLQLSKKQSFACDIFDQESEDEFIFTMNKVDFLPYKDNMFDFVTLFMSAHHFTHMDEMFKEIKRIVKPNGYVLIREHDCTSKNDSIFYNIIHSIYSCVIGKEMTIFDFVKSFIKAEETIYYAKYYSIKEWITLFSKYGFNKIINEHFSYDFKKKDFNFKDQMDSFYCMFQNKK
jgi:ubiquinone/menaquinone biosynthesis C-methylase UbiE